MPTLLESIGSFGILDTVRIGVRRGEHFRFAAGQEAGVQFSVIEWTHLDEPHFFTAVF